MITPITSADLLSPGVRRALTGLPDLAAAFAIGLASLVMPGFSASTSPSRVCPARAVGRGVLRRTGVSRQQLGGRLQNRVAAGFAMADIADHAGLALGPRFQQFFQLRLSLGERQAAYIHSIGEQQIEREEN